jgi:hypothetical protein
VNLPSNCSGMPAPSNRPLAGHWMSLIYPVSLSAPLSALSLPSTAAFVR